MRICQQLGHLPLGDGGGGRGWKYVDDEGEGGPDECDRGVGGGGKGSLSQR